MSAAGDEEGLVPISALQHWLFCPRQCALIHLERIWSEDAATAEGRLLHEKVDAARPETRPGVRIVRSLMLCSRALGVAGRSDVVELRGRPPRPFPVEYKRGRPKSHRADEVQLCAQAICLEEMFGTEVPRGALFYGQTRRRVEVAFDADLRALTARAAEAVRQMFAAGRTPPPHAMPGCRHCSLAEHCAPERLERPPSVARWLMRQIAEAQDETDS